jgi:hypothetical protein
MREEGGGEGAYPLAREVPSPAALERGDLSPYNRERRKVTH